MAFTAGDVSSVQSLERRLCDLGLFPHTESKLSEFPEELHEFCGKGVGIWQYPNQFARYLLFLKEKFSEKPILRYMEIGVAAGGTFRVTREFLRFLCRESGIDDKLVQCVGIDPAGPGCTTRGGETPFTDSFREYLRDAGDSVEFVSLPSTDALPGILPKASDFDLVLIDGDHSYEGVRADHDLLRGRARITVFHDVVSDACPGVVKKWEEVKSSEDASRTFEFCGQYEGVTGSYLGIGVLFN